MAHDMLDIAHQFDQELLYANTLGVLQSMQWRREHIVAYA